MEKKGKFQVLIQMRYYSGHPGHEMERRNLRHDFIRFIGTPGNGRDGQKY